jgi:hypothetical protein
MNVEIGAEAAQFPEKEYINGIAVAVLSPLRCFPLLIFLPIAPIVCHSLGAGPLQIIFAVCFWALINSSFS